MHIELLYQCYDEKNDVTSFAIYLPTTLQFPLIFQTLSMSVALLSLSVSEYSFFVKQIFLSIFG